MDMTDKIKLMPLTADAVEYGVKMAEADGEISPTEAATSRRMIAIIRAAEKMADAIENAEDSRYSMTDAAKAAWEFRKAMRGEL